MILTNKVSPQLYRFRGIRPTLFSLCSADLEKPLSLQLPSLQQSASSRDMPSVRSFSNSHRRKWYKGSRSIEKTKHIKRSSRLSLLIFQFFSSRVWLHFFRHPQSKTSSWHYRRFSELIEPLISQRISSIRNPESSLQRVREGFHRKRESETVEPPSHYRSRGSFR